MLTRAAKKKSWFRAGFAALAILPLPAALAYGCGTPTEYDDLCGWLRDPNNCYRDYFIDVGVTCGAVGQTKIGQFAARDKLDLCILEEGGQVIFEPPIDLAAPPPDNIEPITIKMINPDTTLCGVVTFRAKYDFSVDIEGDPLPEDAGDAALPEEFLVGGKFEMIGGKDTDTLAVTCADASAFNFDRLQITRCTEYEAILPHAEVDFSAGGIDQTGVIRINVFYPPQEGPLED
ncbi:MAG: hypothetical protein JNK04_16520, partial [Myxococcales bacterium]|nr:hypothetical protein [Myxococcales bacterium]